MDDENLDFKSIVIEDIERMEPAEISPDVDEYVVYRKKSVANVKVFVTMNVEPRELTHMNDYQPYISYLVEQKINGGYGNRFLVTASDLPNRHNDFYLSGLQQTVELSIVPRGQCKGRSRTIKLFFPTITITEEERESCTHPETFYREGEWWGGASGSSQVEILTVCKRCEKVISTHFEYNN